jgi:hypothetical protein
MGFFSSSPEDAYLDLYVKLNPGATKAGAKANLAGNKAIGEARAKQREEFFDEQNPKATREQREIGLKILASKDSEKTKKYSAQIKAWNDEYKHIETSFWEDVASGKIPMGTSSPVHIYEMSLRDADEHPAPIPQEVSEQTSNSVDVVGKVKQLKELLDSGLIDQDEFDVKKKELLAKL